MVKRTIDGKGLILGRLGTYVAQRLLRGDEIVILNANDIVVTGKRQSVLTDEQQARDRGSNIRQGPFYDRVPRTFVKKTVKGMLPRNKRGEEALSRLRVFNTTVDSMNADTTIEGASIDKLPNSKFISIARITKAMGGK